MAVYLKIEHCERVKRTRYSGHPPGSRLKLRPTFIHSHPVEMIFFEPCYPVEQWLNEFTPQWRMDRETRRMRFAEPHHDFAFQMRWG